MKKKIVVAGYTIIERKQAGEAMVVVGHNPNASSPYVTWKAYDFTNFTSFNHGHYFSTRQEAMIDYFQRLAEVWEHYTPARHTPPKHRENDPHAK